MLRPPQVLVILSTQQHLPLLEFPTIHLHYTPFYHNNLECTTTNRCPVHKYKSAASSNCTALVCILSRPIPLIISPTRLCTTSHHPPAAALFSRNTGAGAQLAEERAQDQDQGGRQHWIRNSLPKRGNFLWTQEKNEGYRREPTLRIWSARGAPPPLMDQIFAEKKIAYLGGTPPAPFCRPNLQSIIWWAPFNSLSSSHHGVLPWLFLFNSTGVW